MATRDQYIKIIISYFQIINGNEPHLIVTHEATTQADVIPPHVEEMEDRHQ